MPLLLGRALHHGVPDGDRHPDLHQEDRDGQRTRERKDDLRAELARLLLRRVCPSVLASAPASTTAGGAIPSRSGGWRATETATGGQVLFSHKPATGKGHHDRRGARVAACAAHLALEGTRPLRGGPSRRAQHDRHRTVQDARAGRAARGQWLLRTGHVELVTGVEIGTDISGKKLLDDYDAIFVGVGLGEDTKLGVPGEDGPAVVGATSWIERLKTAPAVPAGSAASSGSVRGKRVVVVGGGNTAIDVARECAQLGAEEVTMVYRRAASDMSGYAHEMDDARIEGVRLVERAAPIAFVRDGSGKLTALRLATTKNGTPAPGTSGSRVILRRSPSARPSSPRREGAAGRGADARGIVVDPRRARLVTRRFSGGLRQRRQEVVHAVADGRGAARAHLSLGAEGRHDLAVVAQ